MIADHFKSNDANNTISITVISEFADGQDGVAQLTMAQVKQRRARIVTGWAAATATRHTTTQSHLPVS